MRNANSIAEARETFEGQGAHVNRLFPIGRVRMNYDPFVLWDHFELTANSGFPAHSHRGFEAITYLFEGEIEHRDNMDHVSSITTGGAQRFTAGKGIVHSEIPTYEGITSGIQVWINLPRHLKRLEPAYQQIRSGAFPESISNGVRIRCIAGVDGGIQLKTAVDFMDILFEETSQYKLDVAFAHRGFVYVVNGKANIEGQDIHAKQAYFFEQRTKHLSILAEQGARMLMISGIPHRQPIYQHGTNVD